MILYYLTYILRCVLVGIAIGHFMFKGTSHLVHKEYTKGTAYTLLTYVIIGLELLIFSSNNNNNNNATIVFSIIFVCINILVYIAIRNITKGDK